MSKKETLPDPRRRGFLRTAGATLASSIVPTPVRILASTAPMKTLAAPVAVAASSAVNSIFNIALGWLRFEEQMTENIETHQYILETLRKPVQDEFDIEYLADEIVKFRNEIRWELDGEDLLVRCGELSDSAMLRKLSDESCYVRTGFDYDAALDKLAAAAQKGPNGIKRLVGIRQAQYQTMHAEIDSYVSKNPRLQKEITRLENERKLMNGEVYTNFGTAYQADEMCPIPNQDYYEDGKPGHWSNRVSVMPVIPALER